MPPLQLPLLLPLLLLLLLLSPACLAVDKVHFTVHEESPVGTVVGSLSSYGTSFRYNSKYFKINSSGSLLVKRRLDSDSSDTALCNANRGQLICEHELTAVVQGNSRILSVKVTIKDINDHAPRWPVEQIVVRFSEWSKVGQRRYISPKATDPDAGENAIRRYELSPPSPLFDLEQPRSGAAKIISPQLVLRQPLDREKAQRHSFSLIATDGKGRSSSVSLIVEVGDENDNEPIFERAQYFGSVNEGAPAGTEILKVKANDLDDGQNGNVTYSFSHSDVTEEVKAALNIGQFNGSILVRSAEGVDYESIKHFNFSVVAKDRGSSPFSSTAEVSISIVDLNDNAPQIKKVMSESIKENKSNETVAMLTISDKDAGEAGRFDCSLSSDISPMPFKLTEADSTKREKFFKVTNTEKLDRERVPEWRLRLRCTDRGRPTRSGERNLTVKVGDENDSPPRFSRDTFAFTFKEGNSPGARLANVTAVDEDLGPALKYRIEQASPSPAPFRVDSRGWIYATERLDREANPDGFSFRVVATDSLREASAAVHVKLEDMNDNAPRFSRKHYNFSVEERDNRGLFVGDVNASDSDAGRNGELKFQLHPSDRHLPFEISAGGNGRSIYTSAGIDREAQATFKFKVIAVDSGRPALTGTATVTVTITDVNDCSPNFEFPSPLGDSEVRLSYREPPGFKVTQLRAVDADVGENARIIYSLSRGNLYDLFRIERDTGALFVKKSMTSRDLGKVKLTVKATDSGQGSQSATADLTLSIEDTPATSLLRREWTAEMETNKLIIISIVVATGVICSVLIIAICLMARRQPCSAGAHINHDLVSPSPKANRAAMSPTEMKTPYNLPLLRTDYDDRFGQSKLNTFPHPLQPPAKLGDEQSDSVAESDGDSGKGGSVSNSNSRPGAAGQPVQAAAAASSAAALHGSELQQQQQQQLLQHQQSTPLSFRRLQSQDPDLFPTSSFGGRAMTLNRQQQHQQHQHQQHQQQQQQQQLQPMMMAGNHQGIIAAGPSQYYTIQSMRNKPQMISEDSGPSGNSLV